jgi:c-di-GMP-binding flagellar brake protein YcgR
MNFLKKDIKVKIIPANIKAITSGSIIEIMEGSFVVAISKSAVFETHDLLELIISSQNDIIKFESKVIEAKEDCLYLSNPENIHYSQRREYPRVSISIPVVLKDINNPENSSESVTKNISGGGMQVVADKNFAVGSLLKAKLRILDKESMETMLEILRIDDKDKCSKEYFISGRFKNLSNTQKTALIQVCFKRQLELKFKGVKSGFCGGESY